LEIGRETEREKHRMGYILFIIGEGKILWIPFKWEFDINCFITKYTPRFSEHRHKTVT
jgi:hypothetical protein